MNLTLKRVCSGMGGTFGVLLDLDDPICVTLERPWLDNQKQISCIPHGKYKCVPHTGQKYKGVIRLENVRNREGILIHPGNTINDSTGCILVGTSFASFNGVPGISGSKDAMKKLKSIVPESFTLTVTGV